MKKSDLGLSLFKGILVAAGLKKHQRTAIHFFVHSPVLRHIHFRQVTLEYPRPMDEGGSPFGGLLRFLASQAFGDKGQRGMCQSRVTPPPKEMDVGFPLAP